MDKITVEIKEELKFETILNKNELEDIAIYFIDDVLIPYIEDEYGYKNIVSEALIDKINNTSYDDIAIGMAKAILKVLEKN